MLIWQRTRIPTLISGAPIGWLSPSAFRITFRGAADGLEEMLNLPNDGYRIFQVSLYNEEVRLLAERKKRHCFFDRGWATEQVRDVVARSEAEARALIQERFPPEDGFVVQKVNAAIF